MVFVLLTRRLVFVAYYLWGLCFLLIRYSALLLLVGALGLVEFPGGLMMGFCPVRPGYTVVRVMDQLGLLIACHSVL